MAAGEKGPATGPKLTYALTQSFSLKVSLSSIASYVPAMSVPLTVAA